MVVALVLLSSFYVCVFVCILIACRLSHNVMGWSVVCACGISWSRGYKLFSCSSPKFIKKIHTTQLSMKFQPLLKTKMLKIKISGFQILKYCICHADKFENAITSKHFNINEHDKFQALLS